MSSWNATEIFRSSPFSFPRFFLIISTSRKPVGRVEDSNFFIVCRYQPVFYRWFFSMLCIDIHFERLSMRSYDFILCRSVMFLLLFLSESWRSFHKYAPRMEKRPTSRSSDKLCEVMMRMKQQYKYFYLQHFILFAF